jgi:hypothetical protein
MAEGAYETSFRFLDFPAEIREDIYRNLLVLSVIKILSRNHRRKTGCIRTFKRPCFDRFISYSDTAIAFSEDRMLLRPRRAPQTGGLRINKQIYHEAVVVLYAENVFKLVALWHYCAFFGSLNKDYANMTTRVALEADGPFVYDIFLLFNHWYGRMGRVEEILKSSTDVRE